MSGKQLASSAECREGKAKWTDARLELPDDETTVLCCDAAAETYWIGFHEEGFWFQEGEEDEIDVTHWMHLPDFP